MAQAPTLPSHVQPGAPPEPSQAAEAAAGRLLSEWGPLLVAFSGGVDSSVVLALAVHVLGSAAVLAVTAASPTYPRRELAQAEALAALLGVEHLVLPTHELDLPAFVENPPDRCFHCKRELMATLVTLAQERGLKTVVDGVNADDSLDYRPGIHAADLAGVRHPLVEAGLGKGAVRALAERLGLPNASRPAGACLASRFPYGERISAESLARVEAAEGYLLDLGLPEVRVRHHGAIARIEVPANDVTRLLQPGVRCRVVAELKRLGFTYVALDLEGFRSGSMNEVLASRRCET